MRIVSTLRRLVSAAAALCAVIVGAGSVLRGQQALTPEWIASEAGQRFADTPQTAWRNDGSLWVYDTRDPARTPAFELLNPATGARRTVGDAAKALATLNAATPAREAMKTLPWPASLDEAGQHGLYVLNG